MWNSDIELKCDLTQERLANLESWRFIFRWSDWKRVDEKEGGRKGGREGGREREREGRGELGL